MQKGALTPALLPSERSESSALDVAHHVTAATSRVAIVLWKRDLMVDIPEALVGTRAPLAIGSGAKR